MPDSTASPRAARLATPSWLDARLVLGVLLVLVSVVVGARLLSAADSSSDVWVLTRDLAAGSTLGDGDLRRGQARLFDSGDRYLLAQGDKPVGYVLERGVGADELLPRDSLVRPDEAGRALREVSVPVAAGHLPDDLRAGQLVDVYVTAGPPGATTGTRRVLPAVPVTVRPRAGGLGATAGSGVVLEVPEQDAAVLVTAVQQGAVDLVRVPRGAVLPPLPASALAATPG